MRRVASRGLEGTRGRAGNPADVRFLVIPPQRKRKNSDELKGHRVKILLSVPLVWNVFRLHICQPHLLPLASILNTLLNIISEFLLLLFNISP